MTQPHSSAAAGIAFCSGCNEWLTISGGACPRCGVNLGESGVDRLSDTLLVHEGSDAVHDHGEARADDLSGTELDVFRIDSLIGSGGMGRVYLARHKHLQRLCALKILSPKSAAVDRDYIARFQHEGRATAALVHPNIVTIHAIGEADGYHFLEMEYLPGRSLQQLLRDEKKLTPVRATALVTAIAEGLACAHRADILHRDLKPDNVLLSHQGIPKIADFGLAKRITGKAVPAKGLAGTPNFMAPELLGGHPATLRSDVYALGACYFLLLTGRFPFVASTLPELIVTVTTQPLPSLRKYCPGIPLEMAECLSLLLSKSPENRPADGIEAAQLLIAVQGQLRDIESLLAEAFGGDPNVRWTRKKNTYRLQLSLPDGRSQTLFVEPSDHMAHERLLLIYSTCCPADPAHFEYALRLNSEIPHGGLAIREIDGTARFIMVDTYPRATVDVEEIRRSVLEVAYRADEVEKRLTGRDRH